MDRETPRVMSMSSWSEAKRCLIIGTRIDGGELSDLGFSERTLVQLAQVPGVLHDLETNLLLLQERDDERKERYRFSGNRGQVELPALYAICISDDSPRRSEVK